MLPGFVAQASELPCRRVPRQQAWKAALRGPLGYPRSALFQPVEAGGVGAGLSEHAICAIDGWRIGQEVPRGGWIGGVAAEELPVSSGSGPTYRHTARAGRDCEPGGWGQKNERGG